MNSQINYSWDAIEYSKHSTAQQSCRETFVSQIVETYLENHPADKNGHIHVDMLRLEVEAKKK